MSIKINLAETAHLKEKLLSRRLFLQTLLFSLTAISTIDNSKTNENESQKNNAYNKNKFLLEKPDNETANSDGTNDPSLKGNSQTGEDNPGNTEGSDNTSTKGNN